MKLAFTSLIALALCALSAAAGGAGTKNNSKAAAAISRQSKALPPGQYKFKNVKTGKWLSYERDGQSVFLSSKASWFSVKKHQNHIVMSPSDSNSKCISAQWDYKVGADWAGMLYKCTVASFRKRELPQPGADMEVDEEAEDEEPPREDEARTDYLRLQKRKAVRGAKQYWYIHPAHSSKTAWHIVADDHIDDMSTRVLIGSVTAARSNKSSKGPSMQVMNNNDSKQEWLIFNRRGKQVKP